MAQARAIKPVGQDHLATFSPTDPACPGLGLIERRMLGVSTTNGATEWRAPGLRWPDIRALAGRAQTCFAAGKDREKRPWGNGL